MPNITRCGNIAEKKGVKFLLWLFKASVKNVINSPSFFAVTSQHCFVISVELTIHLETSVVTF